MEQSESSSEDSYKCMCGRTCKEFNCISKGIWICKGCGLNENEDYYHYPARAYSEFVLCLECVKIYTKCDICKQMVYKTTCTSNLPQKHFLDAKFICNKCN